MYRTTRLSAVVCCEFLLSDATGGEYLIFPKIPLAVTIFIALLPLRMLDLWLVICAHSMKVVTIQRKRMCAGLLARIRVDSGYTCKAQTLMNKQVLPARIVSKPKPTAMSSVAASWPGTLGIYPVLRRLKP